MSQMATQTGHNDFQEEYNYIEQWNHVVDNNKLKLQLMPWIKNVFNPEALTIPFREMGVTVTIYGGTTATYKPVDCTGICHSSVMMATRRSGAGSSPWGDRVDTQEQAEMKGMQK